MIYVLTSILNGFDNLRPPAAPASDFARYICFTNIPNLPRVTPWEYRPACVLDTRQLALKMGRWDGIEHRRFGADRRVLDLQSKPEARIRKRRSTGKTKSSRVPKILPHLMLPRDAECSIYYDGNFQLRIDPIEVIEKLLGDKYQWAAHKHPIRDCVYEEAKIVIRDCPLVDSAAVEGQVADYRKRGFPERAGLWANGFLVRRHTPEVARLNELWWEEFSRGSERDQLSFPIAHCRVDMPILTINEDIFASSWILFRWHAAWKHKEDNPDYWKERNETRDRLAELARVTGSDSGIAWLDY